VPAVADGVNASTAEVGIAAASSSTPGGGAGRLAAVVVCTSSTRPGRIDQRGDDDPPAGGTSGTFPAASASGISAAGADGIVSIGSPPANGSSPKSQRVSNSVIPDGRGMGAAVGGRRRGGQCERARRAEAAACFGRRCSATRRASRSGRAARTRRRATARPRPVAITPPASCASPESVGFREEQAPIGVLEIQDALQRPVEMMSEPGRLRE
jgi:hypothetical protein